MDQLPLFQEDSPVNHSQLQENEKEQMTTDTSGMKLLELLPSANRGGLLEKMLTDLLTSKTAWYSDRCKMIWKKRVSKSNVLLFQLAVSVLGIKEKESGLLHTPTATANQGSPSMFKRDQGSWGNHMYPTPNTMDYIDRKGMRPSRAATNRKSGYLSEMINMYPTPTTQDSRIGPNNVKGNQHRVNRGNPALADKVLFPTPRAGGRLNPNFVEFLMGYPTNWTKVE